MKLFKYLLTLTAFSFLTMVAVAGDDNKVNQEWQQCVLAAVDSFPQNGGYYTGARPNDTFKKTAWKGLHQAYKMTLADSQPEIDLQ